MLIELEFEDENLGKELIELQDNNLNTIYHEIVHDIKHRWNDFGDKRVIKSAKFFIRR